MNTFQKCVPVFAVIATIAFGPGAASVSAQAHERIVVEFAGTITPLAPPVDGLISSHVQGFDSCTSGDLSISRPASQSAPSSSA